MEIRSYCMQTSFFFASFQNYGLKYMLYVCAVHTVLIASTNSNAGFFFFVCLSMKLIRFQQYLIIRFEEKALKIAS